VIIGSGTNHLGPASHFAPALLFFVILPQGYRLNLINNYAGALAKRNVSFVSKLVRAGNPLPILTQLLFIVVFHELLDVFEQFIPALRYRSSGYFFFTAPAGHFDKQLPQCRQ